jgi:DNA-directed RNA polymerase subunit RPC12/RpoP
MVSTLVVVCGRCGGLLLAKADQKTRTCPYCGAKIDVEKARTVATAANAYKASEILRKLKNDAFSKHRNIRRQSHL